jgi:hypothetical protein
MEGLGAYGSGSDSDSDEDASATAPSSVAPAAAEASVAPVLSAAAYTVTRAQAVAMGATISLREDQVDQMIAAFEGESESLYKIAEMLRGRVRASAKMWMVLAP